MIGKREWFERRTHLGWGISPKTWQGWVYIAIIVIPFLIFQALPYWDFKTRLVITIGWLIFALFDATEIMITLKRDEREYKIEAMAERNAAWFMESALVIGIVYEAITSALNQSFQVDWFLIAALFGGAIVKTISNIYLEKKAI